MAATPPGLTFDEVTVAVASGTVILDGITLSCPAPSLTCVAGPSGSGKSTLLRLGNRLGVPSSGRVLFDGQDVAALDPRHLRRRVGMVFQRPVVFPGTVRDNLRVAATGDDHVYTAMLDEVGLPARFLDRSADDLSGGEGQRMCIARTLLTGPAVLLMDEPTSALDVDAKLVIERLARQLLDRGLTIVWVTHDLEQAERLGGRVLVLVDGRIVSEAQTARYLAARSFLEREQDA